MGAVSEDESFLAVMTDDVLFVEEVALLGEEDDKECVDGVCDSEGVCCTPADDKKAEEVK
jgi:hypothetical protein